MVTKCTVEQIHYVLNLFQNGHIASLRISMEQKFIIDYSLVSTFDETAQKRISDAAMQSLNTRLNVVFNLNKLYVNMAAGNMPEAFEMTYDITKEDPVYKIAIAWNPKTEISTDYDVSTRLVSTLECLQALCVSSGIKDQVVPGIFMKEQKMNGKRTKTVSVTIDSLIQALQSEICK